VANTNLQIQKTEQTQDRINTMKFTPRYSTIKCSKLKTKNWEGSTQKQHTTYNGTTIQMTPDLSSEIREAKKSGNSIF